jgi:hypothetical protein
MWIENAVAWFAVAANTLAFAQLLAAFVTAIATFALWRVTRVLAVETKTLAAMTSHPFVVASFEPSAADSGAFDVVLRNTGNSTAFNIKLTFTPALRTDQEQEDGKEETSFDVSILNPGQGLPLLGVMYRDAPETNFAVSLSWSSTPSSKERERLEYVTKIYTGISRGWNVKSTNEIANELEKIRKHLVK